MEDAYSIVSHLSMVSDRRRMEAYRSALGQAVTPGCVVADIGTGTGVFAILACQLGARRVYAMEPAGVIEAAAQIASDNGVADRIEFIPELSTRVSLPETVDLVVSDVRGVLPWFGDSVATVIDARERFLAGAGRLIPAGDRVLAALADAREPQPYDANALHGPSLGVDMSAASRFAANAWRRATLSREELVVEAQEWATLDYATVTSTEAEGSLEWTMAHQARTNGLCAWFDTQLLDDMGFSNAPGEPRTIYGQAFFPFETPLELTPGDEVAVQIEARRVEGSYVWRWSTRVTAADASQARVAFDQSSMRSAPVSMSRLRRREAAHRPKLTEQGEIDGFIVSLMDGTRTLADIASRVSARFPQSFSDVDDALRRVSELSETYSR